MSAVDLSGFSVPGQHNFAAVVTTESDGSLCAAPVEYPYIDDDGFLWFFVRSSSFVAANIECCPEILLLWPRVNDSGPAAVSGSGFVITHIGIKQTIWARAGWSMATADPASGDIVLIRVSVRRTEQWDPHSVRVVSHRLVRTDGEATSAARPVLSAAESAQRLSAPPHSNDTNRSRVRERRHSANDDAAASRQP